MQPMFDHEKLNAYQDSLAFIVWAEKILEKMPKGLAVWDQLDRASTSISLNIAEGNGKFTSPDRCRFFDTARGSALECAACLDVLVAKHKFSSEEMHDGKETLRGIVSMLVGLIRSNSPDRLHEEPAAYHAGKNKAETD
jgi:four helix bundle protein